MGYLPGESDILAWAEQQQISCCFLVGTQVTNTPEPGFYVGELSIGAKDYEFRLLRLTQNTTGKTWVSVYMTITGEWVWTDWIPYATATPPQKYSLPLVEGWVRVNAAEYWRTQEGLVIVTFRIARSGGAEISAALHPIATLPEGYRPVGYAAHAAASTMTAVPAVVWVGDDGVIYASAAQDVPGSSDPAPGNWPGFVATLVFMAN